MEAISNATDVLDIDDLDGAMEAIDVDFSKCTKEEPKELPSIQKDLIQQLREKVRPILKPEQDTDDYLVKWLIARSFDVNKAEEMLKKHKRFLKINKLEDLEGYEQPEASKYFHSAVLGYDKEGSIVRTLHIGACDIRGLCYSLSNADCLKFAFYTLYSDAEKQKKDRANDTICDKHVYIIDLQGLSWSAIVQRAVINKTLMLLKSYEANYPERLKVAYIVNVPSFFSFIYSWLKTFLPDSILSKLDIVTQDEYHSKLGKTIDLAIVPAVYGGTRRDADGNPNCQSLYLKPLGSTVPEELLSIDHLKNLKNDPEARKIIVEYKSLFIVEKEVIEPNSFLQWDFQTQDYDIRMGLRYKQNEKSNSEEIIPPHRVDCHIFPESGSLMCEKPGIYELVFDNTYSWMTNKEVLFKVKLEPPLSKNADYED